MIALRADLHTHTLASGHAFGTVKEMVAEAAARGLDMIAITDHAPAMPGSCQSIYFSNLGAVPRRIGDIAVLRGCEANVLDLDASLDLPARILKRLDWVIASLHNNVLYPRIGADYTAAYLALAENPYVDMIGHPDSPEYPFDMERVIPALAAAGKAVELNEHHAFDLAPQNTENARRIAGLCARHGAFVAVDSDAHSCWDLGRGERALAMLEEMNFPEKLVLNASPQRVLDFIKSKKPGWSF